MTIKLTYQCEAEQALEIIEAFAGVERDRRRIVNGEGAQLMCDGSTTFVLREVSTAEPLAPAPGEQRHGSLEPGDYAPAASDTALEDDQDARMLAAGALLDDLAAFFQLEGTEQQADAYDALRRSFETYQAFNAEDAQ